MALPRDALDLPDSDLDRWMYRVYPAARGPGSVLSHFVVSTVGQAAHPHVTGYVRAHLGDPRLSRSSIAAAHHLSPRTLDRLFADQPWSVSGLIRHERLEAVRRVFRQHYGYPPSQARP
jgi:transcriptional regulator GlxA family with amidase domain